VDWLALKCGLTRGAAHERVRVAHELGRRARVAQAFATGEVSYAKVRAITRITDADEETDEHLLRLAAVGTAADLERVAHKWKDLKDQDRGVDPYLRRWDRRTLRRSRTFDGMAVVEIVMPAEDEAEFFGVIDHVCAETSSTGQRRLDALLAIVRAGAGGDAAPPERYMVHVVGDLDALAGKVGARAELLDGTPLSVETLRRMACDAPLIRHVLKGDSEPLDIGHYADGGETNVDNGLLLCPKHHTLVHEAGFTIEGDANNACLLDPRGCYRDADAKCS
jgi:hypothetical protein